MSNSTRLIRGWDGQLRASIDRTYMATIKSNRISDASIKLDVCKCIIDHARYHVCHCQRVPQDCHFFQRNGAYSAFTRRMDVLFSMMVRSRPMRDVGIFTAGVLLNAEWFILWGWFAEAASHVALFCEAVLLRRNVWPIVWVFWFSFRVKSKCSVSLFSPIFFASVRINDGLFYVTK